jgi:hypothetical protein
MSDIQANKMWQVHPSGVNKVVIRAAARLQEEVAWLTFFQENHFNSSMRKFSLKQESSQQVISLETLLLIVRDQ